MITPDKMRYCDIKEIADLLNAAEPPVIDAHMLNAILTNICRKSDALHRRIVDLESRLPRSR